MTRCRWLALSLLLAVPFALGSAPPSGERQQQLRHMLLHDCGSCHGMTLAGGLGPPLLPVALDGKPLEYLSAIILDGRPGSAMPGWRGMLSEADARWLAERLQSGELAVADGS